MAIIKISREKAFQIINDARAIIVASEGDELNYPSCYDDSIVIRLNDDIEITITFDCQDKLIKMDTISGAIHLKKDIDDLAEAEYSEVILIPLMVRRNED